MEILSVLLSNFSHLHCCTPPLCFTICLSDCIAIPLGVIRGWGHWDVPLAGSCKGTLVAFTKLSGSISRDVATLMRHYAMLQRTFSVSLALPQEGAIPPIPSLGTFIFTDILVRYPILQHVERCYQYLHDTPQRQARESFTTRSQQVSGDMKKHRGWPSKSQSRETFAVVMVSWSY